MEQGHSPARWGLLALSKTSPAFRFAKWLHESGASVCTVLPPVPFWGARSSKSIIGEFLEPRWFHLEPRTVFPLSQRAPFNGNLSWNGAEIFTRPRAGELIREAGFGPCEGLVVEHWSLVPFVRAFQPRRLIVLLSRENFPTKHSPKVVRERFTEVLEDADELWIVQGLERQLSLKVLAPIYQIVPRNEFGTPAHWSKLT